MKVNGSNFIHVTFTTEREMCPHIHINVQFTQMSSTSRYTLTGDLPGTNTFLQNRKKTRNPPHQNVLVSRTQVKILYKQQTSSYIK
jgi:hypothetical protein